MMACATSSGGSWKIPPDRPPPSSFEFDRAPCLDGGTARAISLAQSSGADLDVVACIDGLEEFRLFVSGEVGVGAFGANAQLRAAIGEQAQDRRGRNETVRVVRIVHPEPHAQKALGLLRVVAWHGFLHRDLAQNVAERCLGGWPWRIARLVERLTPTWTPITATPDGMAVMGASSRQRVPAQRVLGQPGARSRATERPRRRRRSRSRSQEAAWKPRRWSG